LNSGYPHSDLVLFNKQNSVESKFECPKCGHSDYDKRKVFTVPKDISGRPDSMKAKCNNCGHLTNEVSFWKVKKK